MFQHKRLTIKIRAIPPPVADPAIIEIFTGCNGLRGTETDGLKGAEDLVGCKQTTSVACLPGFEVIDGVAVAVVPGRVVVAEKVGT